MNRKFILNGTPGSITDVAGIQVGHFTDSRQPTGCSVVLTPQGAVAAVDVRGAAPGTRETDLLDPTNMVPQVHAILLSGGSAFGLDSASGVVRWLEQRGVGLDTGFGRVPIVPTAVLFDLALQRVGAAVRPHCTGWLRGLPKRQHTTLCRRLCRCWQWRQRG